MNRQEKYNPPSAARWMWGNIFKRKDLSRDSIRESLQNIPLFQNLSSKELAKIEENLYLRKYRTDEFVFREGEPGLGMYIIHQGSVWIQMASGPGKDVVEPILELEKGDFFGEMALVEEHPHVVSARANSYTELLGFFRPDFLTLVHFYPRLGSKLLISLSRIISTRFRAALAGKVQS